MWRATGMNVDLRALTCPPTGGPGVIEMNVGDEDLFDFVWIETVSADSVEDSFERAGRAGLDKREFAPALNQE